MISRFLFLVATFVIALTSLSVLGQDRQKTKVMLLGTFHFDNPGLDVANTNVDNVLTPKRQTEIRALVKRLKKFNPTKIAIESEYSGSRARNEYQSYLKNTYKLSRNEIDQIGYRLAKELGHKEIYPVDWHGKFDFGGVANYAKANGQKKIAESFVSWAKNFTAKIDSDLKRKSISEVIRELNDEQTLESLNRLYFSLALVGSKTNYSGADLLSDWFERNLKIYTNILRISEDGDRILLPIGASHVPIIRRFLEDSDFDVVDVNEYL